MIKYIFLGLSVNMRVFVWVVCMLWIALSIAFNSALRIFWCPGNFLAMCIF